MNALLAATCEALPRRPSLESAISLATETAARLRPLVAQAGAVINGARSRHRRHHDGRAAGRGGCAVRHRARQLSRRMIAENASRVAGLSRSDQGAKDYSMSDPRAYPERPFLAVSAAIIRDGRVLVARRAKARERQRRTFHAAGRRGRSGRDAASGGRARDRRGDRPSPSSRSRWPVIASSSRATREGRVERHFVILCFAARWLAGEGRPERGAVRAALAASGGTLRAAHDRRARRDRHGGIRAGWKPRKPPHRAPPCPCRTGGAYRRAMLARAFAILLLALRRFPRTPSRQPRPARARPTRATSPGSAEIMGALHYLRELCGAREGQTWRSEMQALIEAEAPSGERRDRLDRELQPWLSRLPAELPHLYAGRELRDPPLSRRGLAHRPRRHRALHKLGRSPPRTCINLS